MSGCSNVKLVEPLRPGRRSDKLPLAPSTSQSSMVHQPRMQGLFPSLLLVLAALPTIATASVPFSPKPTSTTSSPGCSPSDARLLPLGTLRLGPFGECLHSIEPSAGRDEECVGLVAAEVNIGGMFGGCDHTDLPTVLIEDVAAPV